MAARLPPFHRFSDSAIAFAIIGLPLFSLLAYAITLDDTPLFSLFSLYCHCH
jgi:hypothetical protein